MIVLVVVAVVAAVVVVVELYYISIYILLLILVYPQPPSNTGCFYTFFTFLLHGSPKNMYRQIGSFVVGFDIRSQKK